MAIRLANFTFNRDPKTGRVKIVRSWHVDEETEIEEAPDVSVMGYFWTGELNASNWDPNDITQGFQVDAIYEGLAANYTDGIEKAKWSFNPGFEKEPIEKHPDILYLIENYGGQEDADTGRVTFTKTLSREVTREGILSAGLFGFSTQQVTSTQERANPLYGLNESGWLSMYGTATAKFISTEADHLDKIGQIVEELPGNPPDFGIDADRNWLKVPPLIEEIPQSEDASERLFDITLNYLLSAKGGWPPAVYQFIDV